MARSTQHGESEPEAGWLLANLVGSALLVKQPPADQTQLSDLTAPLPRPWQPRLALSRLLRRSPYKVAILDDDPTGTQAAKDIDVLLSWDTKTLRTALFSSERAFFVLLNSRALPETQAAHLVSRVVHKIGW